MKKSSKLLPAFITIVIYGLVCSIFANFKEKTKLLIFSPLNVVIKKLYIPITYTIFLFVFFIIALHFSAKYDLKVKYKNDMLKIHFLFAKFLIFVFWIFALVILVTDFNLKILVSFIILTISEILLFLIKNKKIILVLCIDILIIFFNLIYCLKKNMYNDISLIFTWFIFLYLFFEFIKLTLKIYDLILEKEKNEKYNEKK